MKLGYYFLYILSFVLIISCSAEDDGGTSTPPPTTQHDNMHPDLGERSDCTHYCSTPFVYYPLWRSLRYALNRQFP